MYAFLLLLVVFLAGTYADTKHFPDSQLFHFVTRPDLTPPKWKIDVYNESLLAPGYWFVAPKHTVKPSVHTKATWSGPTIYDGKGQLIWSGSDQLDSPNVMDFRLSEAFGEQMLTFYDRDRGSGLVLDNHYNIRRVMEVVESIDSESVNGHQFKTVDQGTKALVMGFNRAQAPQNEREDVGFHGPTCWALYNTIYELDLETGDVTWSWDSYGKIGLGETLKVRRTDIPAKCEKSWDFLHANSIDKTDDGHYLLNSRFLNAIYKISKDDGSILWRLGGKKSDFDLGDLWFTRQHDITFRSQNETHIVMTLLDNADEGVSDPNLSRGLVLAANEKDMTVSVEAHYDHPNQGFAFAKGNMQTLDNGNVFLGWSARALQSEHAPDGTLLMKALFRADYAGSYRNYKFDFVGRPLTRPDVHATTHVREKEDEKLTRVYVSWNGDTEVQIWRLYSTAADGSDSKLIGSVERKGFETDFEVPYSLDYVRLEGVDGEGNSVGNSNVIKTIDHPDNWDVSISHDEVTDYDRGYGYRQDQPLKGVKKYLDGDHFIGTPVFALMGFGCIVGIVLSARLALSRFRWRRPTSRSYSALPTDEQDTEEKFDQM